MVLHGGTISQLKLGGVYILLKLKSISGSNLNQLLSFQIAAKVRLRFYWTITIKWSSSYDPTIFETRFLKVKQERNETNSQKVL